jgi:hypothetical protein
MSRNFSLDWSSGSVVDVIAAKGVDRRIGARPGGWWIDGLVIETVEKPSNRHEHCQRRDRTAAEWLH